MIRNNGYLRTQDEKLVDEDITQVLERDDEEENQSEKNVINYLLLSSRYGRI